MIAYLILKLLCNIYQSLNVRSEKSATLERTKTYIVWIERDPERDLPKSLLKLLVRKIISYVLIVIWIAFITRSKVVSRKALNGLNRKNISLESSLKAPDS